MNVPIYGVRRTDTAAHEFDAEGWPDWSGAEALWLRKIRHEPEDGLPLREATEVVALWDPQFLYLAFTIFDREVWATITVPEARLFVEECVEVFLDPDGDGHWYVELQVNALGTVRDLLVDGSIEGPSAAQFDAMAQWHFCSLRRAVSPLKGADGTQAGWRLQLAIPWRDLDFCRRQWPPSPGEELRINFYRYERSREGTAPLELSGWSLLHGSFHQPARFGRFLFRDGD